MSKLDELIHKLCPDGVEFKPLGEVCILSRGKVYSKDYLKDNPGEFPVYSSQTANNGELGRINTYDCEGDYLTWTTDGAHAGTIFHRTGKFSITNVCGLIKIKESNLYIRFLYYWLSIKAKGYVNQGMGNPKLMTNQIEVIPIPLPPLPVQEEIVRLLDQLTETTQKYQAELEAELDIRKKQYEEYREQLLDLEGKEGVEMKTLGEICDTLSGYPFDSSLFSDEGVRLMRGMNVKRGYFEFNNELNKYWSSSKGLEKFLLKENDIIISMDGSLVGRSFCYVTKDILPLLLVQRVARLRTNGNYKYIYHNISKSFPTYVDKKKTAGAIPHISMKDINNFIIPFPPLTEQERIVNILDRMDKTHKELCQSIETEIKMRKQQYEYYRNQLLDFKKKEE